MTTAFPRRVRLQKSAEFSHVFAKAGKSTDHYFTVLYRPNTLGYARLGLAITRKVVRSAVVRNRIKRLVRESFRHHQHSLPGVDIVVLARPKLEQQNNAVLFDSMSQHWHKLAQS